jgi:hypothetical protein
VVIQYTLANIDNTCNVRLCTEQEGSIILQITNKAAKIATTVNFNELDEDTILTLLSEDLCSLMYAELLAIDGEVELNIVRTGQMHQLQACQKKDVCIRN